MKTKIVTIHNWDGSKYDVVAPAKARYVGIYCNTGNIVFYPRKPKLDQLGHGLNEEIIWGYADTLCPEENLPNLDGYGKNGKPYELLLKIEEV